MIWIVFVMGVVNFYFHRAVMEGDGPIFSELAESLGRFGWGWGAYALEFGFLVAALWFAQAGSAMVLFIYGLYTAMNIGGYFMLKQMGER